MLDKINIRKNVSNLKPSITLQMKNTLDKMKQDGKNIYMFGMGQSPFPIPNELILELKKYSDCGTYLSSKGLLELRKKIAIFYKKYTVSDISPEQIIIGPGSKELLYLTQYILPSDIIIPTPYWPSYVPQSNICQNQILKLDTTMDNSWKIQPNELENLLSNTKKSQKILILNNPCNPTGQVYTDTELLDISKVLRKYDIIVISDEIYSDFSFNTYTSISKYYPEKTIICSGISKFLSAGGWRLGFMIYPKEMLYILDILANIASETYGSVAHPIQRAAIIGFDDKIKTYKNLCIKILSELSHIVYNKFINNNISVIKCQAAFYLFPNFSSKIKSIELYNQWNTLIDKPPFNQWVFNKLLDETGIGVISGNLFGRPDNELSCRIALVDFNGKILFEKSHHEIINSEFIKQYCYHLLNGIDKMINWWNLSK